MTTNLSTRREFLQKSLAILAVAPTVPAFLDQTVLALADPRDLPLTQRPTGKDGKILVVVQLSGGNDGLNTVIPYADDAYHRARPTLAIDPNTVLKIDDYLSVHPNLAPLNGMFERGEMSILQGVGYPNPNRSHFRAMDIWHSAQPENQTPTTGWIGRYLDNACAGCDPHVGVSVGQSLPMAMQGRRITPLSFANPQSYRYNGPDAERYLLLNQTQDMVNGGPEDVGSAPRTIAPAGPQSGPYATHNSPLDYLHRMAMDAQVSSDQILRVTRAHEPRVDYPRTGFGQGLRTIAAMIAGGLPTRVYYVSLGGFDTHANQRGTHDRLMTQFAEGIAAFWKDLAEQRNHERVLMMSFSEFGRRVQANASNGTDHGAAAPMFLFGSSLRHQVFGAHPSLSDLYRGDLKFNLDFRSVYGTILQQWLETPSRPILGQQFPLLPVFKG